MPKKNGPYPRRCFTRNANTPSVKVKNAAVNGSRYAVEIRNPRPSEETVPAYSGQHSGHASFGRSATPIPGAASKPCLQVRAPIRTSPSRSWLPVLNSSSPDPAHCMSPSFSPTLLGSSEGGESSHPHQRSSLPLSGEHRHSLNSVSLGSPAVPSHLSA